MNMFLLIIVFCGASIFLSDAGSTEVSHGKVVMCNIFTQSIFDDIQIESIDFNLCTHLIVLDKSFRNGRDPWDLTDPFRERDYEQITSLRKTFPHLNVSLCISHNPAEYFEIASKPRNRRRFITYAFDFLMRYKFDGLHLKWFDTKKLAFSMSYYDKVNDFHEIILCSIFSDQHSEKGESSNKEVFTRFMKELKEKFEWNHLLLTSSFVGEKQFLFETFDYPKITKYLDFIQFSLHEYDPPLLHFTLEYALKSRSTIDLENVIDTIIKLGVPSTKILIESVFMGIELDFELRTTKHFTYYQICNELANRRFNGWEIDFDSDVGLAVAMNKGRSHAIIFENSRAIANKMRFVLKRNLAGTLVSCVNTDDYLGQCGNDKSTYDDYIANTNITLNIPKRESNRFPLLNTVNEAIVVAIDENNQNISDKIIRKIDEKTKKILK